MLGQSFTLSSQTKIYGVKVSGTSSSGVTNFRLGNSADLSTYLTSVSSVSMSSSGVTYVIFPSPITLEAGVYYFGFMGISGTTNLYINTSGTYSGGGMYYNSPLS